MGQSLLGPPYFPVWWMLWDTLDTLGWGNFILWIGNSAFPSGSPKCWSRNGSSTLPGAGGDWICWIMGVVLKSHQDCCHEGECDLEVLSVLLSSPPAPAVAQVRVFPSRFSGCVLHWSKEKGVICLLLYMPSLQLPDQWVAAAIEQACTHGLFYCTAPQKEVSDRQGSSRNLTPSSPLRGFNVFWDLKRMRISPLPGNFQSPCIWK